jgi:antirestriction protein ArdC
MPWPCLRPPELDGLALDEPSMPELALPWMTQAAEHRTPCHLTFEQALGPGGRSLRRACYFVKQLENRKDAEHEASTRPVPMMGEYTAFDLDQCDMASRAGSRREHATLYIAATGGSGFEI